MYQKSERETARPKNGDDFLESTKELQLKGVERVSRGTVELIQQILGQFELGSPDTTDTDLTESRRGSLKSLLQIAAYAIADYVGTGVRLEINDPEIVGAGTMGVMDSLEASSVHWKQVAGMVPVQPIKLPSSTNTVIGRCELMPSSRFNNGRLEELRQVIMPVVAEHLWVGAQVWQALEMVKENLKAAQAKFDRLLLERDPHIETEGHTIRMIYLALLTLREYRTLAKQYYDPEEMLWAGLAARAHDWGKIFTPSLLIKSPGQLPVWAKDLMKDHVDKGVSIARRLSLPIEVIQAISQHHENYNGVDGYPQGLSGRGISIGGWLMRVIDYGDARAAPRGYHQPQPVLSLLDEMINHHAGRLFEPKMVEAFNQVHLNQPLMERLYQRGEVVSPADLLASFAETGMRNVFEQAVPSYFGEMENLNAWAVS